jgi:hypothetical protein
MAYRQASGDHGCLKSKTASYQESHRIFLPTVGDIGCFIHYLASFINPIEGEVGAQVGVFSPVGAWMRGARIGHIEHRAWFWVTEAKPEKVKSVGLR